ncbi:MAG TPA: methionyl-tRNA formyltransferase [Thermodesulfobacteriota bacterium]|nr:methionyl-tRNA formyltransferase [Thermodesulfobacteriota bacterium]
MGSSRIVFMGTPRFAVPSLEALIGAGHRVVAVVTQPDKPRGRGLSPLPSPVKEAATGHGTPVLEPVRLRDDSFVRELKGFGADFFVVVAYGKILPQTILDIPPGGCVNVHASLLPKYRGAAPINRAIVNGEAETGVSTMLMDAGMDTGPVLLEKRVRIGADETAEDLSGRLSTLGAALLVETIGLLSEKKISPRAQDESKATYAPMLKKGDGEIDWTKTAGEIRDLVRGMYPWPGAYTRWKGRTVKIHSGRVVEGQAKRPAGTVESVSEEGVSVATGSGLFKITELQPENKKRMPAALFVRGYRMAEGDRFAE